MIKVITLKVNKKITTTDPIEMRIDLDQKVKTDNKELLIIKEVKTDPLINLTIIMKEDNKIQIQNLKFKNKGRLKTIEIKEEVQTNKDKTTTKEKDKKMKKEMENLIIKEETKIFLIAMVIK